MEQLERKPADVRPMGRERLEVEPRHVSGFSFPVASMTPLKDEAWVREVVVRFQLVGIFSPANGSVTPLMPTHTLSRSSRGKRTPARRRRRSSRPAVTTAVSLRGKQPRRATRAASIERVYRSQLPSSEEVVAAVREELARLTKRWKNLLPQLRLANSRHGSRRRRSSKRRARA
jgi:hypothetical protein